MPSLGDSAVIILLGLLLFGPKGLAQIARQLGKLMGEFRRASNEFRMQMEEELRISEQADRQKEIAAIEAAAPPPAPVLGTDTATSTATYDCPEDNARLHAAPADQLTAEMNKEASSLVAGETSAAESTVQPPIGEVEPLPIAVSGDLKIMPPATGLPQPRSSSSQSLGSLVNSIPHEEPAAAAALVEPAQHDYSAQRPNRYTNGHTDVTGLNDSDHSIPPLAEAAAAHSEAQESLHG